MKGVNEPFKNIQPNLDYIATTGYVISPCIRVASSEIILSLVDFAFFLFLFFLIVFLLGISHASYFFLFLINTHIHTQTHKHTHAHTHTHTGIHTYE